MKIVVLTGCFLLLHTLIIAQALQVLTIEGVYEMAMQHYPQVQKRKLISKSKEYCIQNAFRGHYPRIQNLLLHQVQLLMAKYHYNIIAGN